MFTAILTAKKFLTVFAVCCLAAVADRAAAVDAQKDVDRTMTDIRNEQDRVSREAARINRNASDNIERAVDSVKQDAARAGQAIRDDVDSASRHLKADYDRSLRNANDRFEDWKAGNDDDRFGDWANSNSGIDSRNVPIRDPNDRAWAIERANLSNSMSQDGRKDLQRLEERRDKAQRNYFEKRRDYEEKLSKAQAGSGEESRAREDLQKLAADHDKEMRKFQEDLKDLERRTD